MIKYLFFLLMPFCLASPVQAMRNTPHNRFISNTYTHTHQLELKPASLDNSYKTASVCFLGVGDCNGDGFDMSVDTAQQCLNEGFVKLNCSSVQQIENACPYNSAYGKSCICASDLITCPADKSGVGEACDGKYASCSCNAEYQYNSSNCTSPRSVSGSSCNGKYMECSCPTGVSAGAYGCQEYYPAPCGSVCKIAKSDNCANRTAVSTPYGCMTYFSDCPSKCERAYPDNCRNRTEVTCQFDCSYNFADCQSKCQSCNADNCANRTGVTLPNNAACNQYFSDCSSKCSSWVCNKNFIYWCSPVETNCTTLGYNKIPSQCNGDYVVCPYGNAVYCVN